MAYSTAKFKAISLFQTVLNMKYVRQMFAYPDSATGFIQTPFISLTSFIGIPNSMRILYKTSLLTESYAFLKSINSWWIASLHSHFFSSIWWMQDTWSVIDLVRQNPQWGTSAISSAYEINLDSRMFDKILYEVDKSDMTLKLLHSVSSPFL